MDNPVSTVTGAVKSAISPKNIIYAVISLVVILAIADVFGVSAWILTPVSKFKASRAAAK